MTDGTPSSARAIASATLSATFASMPLFLTGSMAVLMRTDLDFSRAALGTAASAFTAATALAAVPGGTFSERVGAQRAMYFSVGLSTLCMFGVAFASESWIYLLTFLVFGGVANGIAQPTTNMLLATGVDPSRQGVGFGIKRSSFGLGELLGGVAAAAIGVNFGWRAAWIIAGFSTLATALLLPRRPQLPATRSSNRPKQKRKTVGPLKLFAVAGGFGLGGIAATQIYFVESAVSRGLNVKTAGLLLAIGGGGGIAARLIMGWAADRQIGAPFVICALMLSVGSVGFVIVGFTDYLLLIGLGTVLIFGAGEGWTGLFFLGVIRANPRSPAPATGRIEAGLSTGGVVGPLIFGGVLASASLLAAWMVSALSLLVGAVLILIGHRILSEQMRSALTEGEDSSITVRTV